MTAPIPSVHARRKDPDGRIRRTRWQRFFAPGVDSNWLMLCTTLVLQGFLLYNLLQHLDEYSFAWWHGTLIVLFGVPLFLCLITRTLCVIALKSALPRRLKGRLARRAE